MKQEMADRFKKNELENAVFAKMLDESLAKTNEDMSDDLMNRKFEGIKTMSKSEAMRIMAEY